MLQREIALRGAIAYGDFIRRDGPGGVFVAGKAIVDAYHFEQQQDWVGIMLAPTAFRQKPDLPKLCTIGPVNNSEQIAQLRERMEWAGFLQSCTIPFHRDNPLEPNPFEGFAIVPSDGVAEPASLRDSLDRSLNQLTWLKSLAPNPPAQNKHERAYRWLQSIRGNWSAVANRITELSKGV